MELDEYSDERLMGEVMRRYQSRIEGKCDNCHRVSDESICFAGKERHVDAVLMVLNSRMSSNDAFETFKESFRAFDGALPDVRVLAEVYLERLRQDAKWGEQNHPDGTRRSLKALADHFRKITNRHHKNGKLTFRDIALEEDFEAFAETEWPKLRAELIQSTAVRVAWICAGDRRTQ